jgi:hypothetical protein
MPASCYMLLHSEPNELRKGPFVLDVQMSLLGLDWLQINQLAGRALQFQIGQLELRLQFESDRYQQLEKKHSKLKQTIKEVHTKNVTAMNIMEGRLSEALKELDAERARSAMFQKKMQEESRQKRRLEDEVQQRRWQRSSAFLTNTLTAPLKRIGDGGGGAAAGGAQSDASAHASKRATGRNDKEVRGRGFLHFLDGKKLIGQKESFSCCLFLAHGKVQHVDDSTGSTARLACHLVVFVSVLGILFFFCFGLIWMCRGLTQHLT